MFPAAGSELRRGLALACVLLGVSLAACEVHKPADVAAAGQTDAAPSADGTVLLGGPTSRVASADSGFVLLGGPPAARARPAKAFEHAAASPDAATAAELAQARIADGAVDWGYGAPRVRHARTAPVSVPVVADAALSATPISVPLEAELIAPSDMHLDTGAPPATSQSFGAPPADALRSGGPRIVGFGRFFCFVLCVLAVATLWRWRRHALQQPVPVRAPPPPSTAMRPRRRIS